MNERRSKWMLWIAIPILFLVSISRLVDLPFQGIVLEPQKTGITTFNFYDQERDRPLVTEVWYPVDSLVPSKPANGFWVRCEEARDAPLNDTSRLYPLIVISHGNGGDRFNLSWLAEILASNGYIVAAMDHYGNTWNNKIPECYAKPWERPKDVSFIIDQLLRSPSFQDRIDRSKIGFVGYSLGGTTGMWIAGGKMAEIPLEEISHYCTRNMPGIVTDEVIAEVDFTPAKSSYSDPRVSAVVVLAPALGPLFDEKSLKGVKIPVYIIAAAKDQITPLESNARRFAKTLSKASLKILNNEATHYVFLSRASLIGKRILEPRYCEDPSSVNRKQIHEEVAKSAVKFFNASL